LALTQSGVRHHFQTPFPGSDLDGGIGLEESPEEIDTIAVLGMVGAAAPAEMRDALPGENWLNFLRSALP
jgi:membrane dipeptidase